MKSFGVLLSLTGALAMSVSLSSPISASVHDVTPVSGIRDLGFLQHQLMIFVAGLAVMVLGVVIAFAAIIGEQRAHNDDVIDTVPVAKEFCEPSASDLPLTRVCEVS